ncbi:hypothetical protein CH63R_10557 [Colletotrichum higginsianum IMI 349063]|uniref:Uncharacterized protein n=1 Tax=Colletotrichum higginsianum (strain IMI 349063) TaxID=759273 RepID=A0A1B7Y336_COLHI|nr:uncharacterized protein CH63R_10557 [Colletotrichum higginsianum IMI 349063]OBR06437.1 hypothetical protein CH63R_10557 [Colletotrichum higginsianum IMI 349063]
MTPLSAHGMAAGAQAAGHGPWCLVELIWLKSSETGRADDTIIPSLKTVTYYYKVALSRESKD